MCLNKRISVSFCLTWTTGAKTSTVCYQSAEVQNLSKLRQYNIPDLSRTKEAEALRNETWQQGDIFNQITGTFFCLLIIKSIYVYESQYNYMPK